MGQSWTPIHALVDMAALIGAPMGLAVLALILFVACDPTAIALTVAASRRG